MPSFLFTSESVTEGHPDKLCDRVSDAILDAYIAQDPDCRIACETLTKTGFVMIAGEASARGHVDIPAVARKAIKEIGYTSSDMGFDYATCGVMVALEEQSPDIAQGVDRGADRSKQGAGDQGLMFGYACDETKELMPTPIMLAHKLAQQLAKVRKKQLGGVDWLRPDGKTQVSVRYENDRPVGIEAVVVSTQHGPEVKRKQIEEAMRELVIDPMLPKKLIGPKTKFHINPTGKFVVGGPQGDAGLTGRKIIVDTYGGFARHGGGAFSGKDPSKVDRSATYYARFIAKHVVAAGLARRCEVQLAYAIGVAKPVSMLVDTFGTGVVDDEKISRAVARVFDARPGLLVDELELRNPIFEMTAAYGHFGRSRFSWEATPRIEELQAAAGVGNGTAVSAKKVAGKKVAAKKAVASKRSAGKKAVAGKSNGVGAKNGVSKNGVGAKNGVSKNGVSAKAKANGKSASKAASKGKAARSKAGKSRSAQAN